MNKKIFLTSIILTLALSVNAQSWWKNKKVKLTKEEFSMYMLIKNTETELRYFSQFYPKSDLIKMNDWFVLGLRWFRTTNPKGYMRLLD